MHEDYRTNEEMTGKAKKPAPDPLGSESELLEAVLFSKNYEDLMRR